MKGDCIIHKLRRREQARGIPHHRELWQAEFPHSRPSGAPAQEGALAPGTQTRREAGVRAGGQGKHASLSTLLCVPVTPGSPEPASNIPQATSEEAAPSRSPTRVSTGLLAAKPLSRGLRAGLGLQLCLVLSFLPRNLRRPSGREGAHILGKVQSPYTARCREPRSGHVAQLCPGAGVQPPLHMCPRLPKSPAGQPLAPLIPDWPDRETDPCPVQTPEGRAHPHTPRAACDRRGPDTPTRGPHVPLLWPKGILGAWAVSPY
ncbi:hypothetical protein P7K49_040157, partial [Saguinus oedipus]